MIVNENGNWRVVGRVEFDNAAALRRDGEQSIAAHNIERLDLSETECIDSSILAVLLAWKRYVKQHQHQLTFENIPDNLQALIDVCNVKFLLG